MEQNNRLQGPRTKSGIPRNRQTRIQLRSPPRIERNPHGPSTLGYNLRSSARNRRQNANDSTQNVNDGSQNTNNHRTDSSNRRQNSNNRRQNASNRRPDERIPTRNVNNPRPDENDLTQIINDVRQFANNLRPYGNDFRQAADNLRQAADELIQDVNNRRQNVPPLRIRRQVFRRRQNPYLRGLTPERIGRFQHFDADESMVGQHCIVCMSDLEVGTKMVRLDCHVDHYLCKTCTDGWFKGHRTCPTCRHAFN